MKKKKKQVVEEWNWRNSCKVWSNFSHQLPIKSPKSSSHLHLTMSNSFTRSPKFWKSLSSHTRRGANSAASSNRKTVAHSQREFSPKFPYLFLWMLTHVQRAHQQSVSRKNVNSFMTTTPSMDAPRKQQRKGSWKLKAITNWSIFISLGTFTFGISEREMSLQLLLFKSTERKREFSMHGIDSMWVQFLNENVTVLTN